MLYISRIVDERHFGITDTDDSVETIVNYTELQNAVRLGLDIKGINVVRNDDYGVFTIVGIEVVQDEAKSTPQRTKTLVLKGVDVKSSDGRITSITWDKDRLAEKTVIRLSNFGDRCAECIFFGASKVQSEIVVILDDKVRILPNTFKDVFRDTRITIDLREVKNDKIAKIIYMGYIEKFGGSLDYMRTRIIDNSYRFDIWTGVFFCYFGYDVDGSFQYGHDVDAEVGAVLYKKLESIANMQFKLDNYFRDTNWLKDWCVKLSKDEARWTSDNLTYAEACELYGGSAEVFRFVKKCTSKQLNTDVFHNYLRYFRPSKDIEGLFVKFCRRAYTWLFEIGRQNAWI